MILKTKTLKAKVINEFKNEDGTYKNRIGKINCKGKIITSMPYVSGKPVTTKAEVKLLRKNRMKVIKLNQDIK